MSGVGSCSACGATFIGGHDCPKPERELATLRADLARVTAERDEWRALDARRAARVQEEQRLTDGHRAERDAARAERDAARAQLRDVAPIVRAATAEAERLTLARALLRCTSADELSCPLVEARSVATRILVEAGEMAEAESKEGRGG